MFSEFSRDLLGIYLNDHLAASTAGLDLCKRSAKSNDGTEYGDFLKPLAAELEADRNQVEDIMGRLGVSRDQIKVGAGWLGEKLGRLKLNGRLLEYSPLSRVIELEGLLAGVTAKLGLWQTVAAAAPTEPRIADIDFVRLVERATEQLETIDELHAAAAAEMVAAGG